RIDVRHGAVADGQDEGERVEGRLPDDGVQADGGGLEDLAVAEWVTVAVEGHRRGSVCRWGGANRSRLTQPPSTTFDNCSGVRPAVPVLYLSQYSPVGGAGAAQARGATAHSGRVGSAKLRESAVSGAHLRSGTVLARKPWDCVIEEGVVHMPRTVEVT